MFRCWAWRALLPQAVRSEPSASGAGRLKLVSTRAGCLPFHLQQGRLIFPRLTFPSPRLPSPAPRRVSPRRFASPGALSHRRRAASRLWPREPLQHHLLSPAPRDRPLPPGHSQPSSQPNRLPFDKSTPSPRRTATAAAPALPTTARAKPWHQSGLGLYTCFPRRRLRHGCVSRLRPHTLTRSPYAPLTLRQLRGRCPSSPNTHPSAPEACIDVSVPLGEAPDGGASPLPTLSDLRRPAQRLTCSKGGSGIGSC